MYKRPNFTAIKVVEKNITEGEWLSRKEYFKNIWVGNSSIFKMKEY